MTEVKLSDKEEGEGREREEKGQEERGRRRTGMRRGSLLEVGLEFSDSVSMFLFIYKNTRDHKDQVRVAYRVHPELCSDTVHEWYTHTHTHSHTQLIFFSLFTNKSFLEEDVDFCCSYP